VNQQPNIEELLQQIRKGIHLAKERGWRIWDGLFIDQREFEEGVQTTICCPLTALACIEQPELDYQSLSGDLRNKISSRTGLTRQQIDSFTQGFDGHEIEEDDLPDFYQAGQTIRNEVWEILPLP